MTTPTNKDSLREEQTKRLLLLEEISINFGDGSGDGKAHCDLKQIYNWVTSHIEEAERKGLEKAHKCVDDTIIVITTDQSQEEQENIYQIRKQHKAEIHANIDKEIEQLNSKKGKPE